MRDKPFIPPRARLDATELETRDTPASNFLASGAEAGGQPLVQVFRPDGSTLAQFSAFETGFQGGVRVATGEIDGNPNTVEVVAAAGPGGGPRVNVFSVNTATGDVAAIGSFFAFDPSFTGGVRVAAGNFLGDATFDEIVVAADAGGGPRVRVLSFADGQATPIAGPLGDFFAFDAGFTGGVRVAAGELDGNAATDELVVGAGAGGGSRVTALNASGAVVRNFFAEPGATTGTNVAVDTTFGALGVIRTDQLDLDFSQRNAALNNLAVPLATAVTGVAPGTGTGFTTGFNTTTGTDTSLTPASGGVLPGGTPATTVAPGVNFSTVASPGSPSAVGNGGNGVLTSDSGSGVPFTSGSGSFGTSTTGTGGPFVG